MMNEEWMIANLRDDLALQMWLFRQGKIPGIDMEKMRKLNEILGTELDLSDPATLKDNVSVLLDQYGIAATKYILEKAGAFADSRNRKLMIVLFDPYRVTRSLVENGTRYDQELVEWLGENAFNYFDMNMAHLADFRSFNLTFEEYLKRYFIGHYNPAGNHFFAFAIKDRMVEWLEPKPITYQEMDKASIEFTGYLEGMKH